MELSEDKPPIIEDILNWLTIPDEPEYVLKGSAGTGKSFLLAHVLKGLTSATVRVNQELYNSQSYTPVMVATTNKAAKVLSDLWGKEVKTIHTLLGLTVRANYSTGKEELQTTPRTSILQDKLIIIDEAFKIGEELLSLIRKLCVTSKVLYVGCPDQIAPTGCIKSPIADIKDNVSELTITNRFNEDSAIAHASSHYKAIVRSGIFTPLVPKDNSVKFISGQEFQDKIVELYKSPKQDPNKVKILTWKNTTSTNYALHVRELLSGSKEVAEGEQLVVNSVITDQEKKKLIASVDKILTVSYVSPLILRIGIPCREVIFKNLVGTFLLAENQIDVKKAMKKLAKEKDWTNYFNLKYSFIDLRPVYSCTVDKSQGSTYETVFIDVGDIGQCWEPNYVARMMHVALSRATHQVYIFDKLPRRYNGL